MTVPVPLTLNSSLSRSMRQAVCSSSPRTATSSGRSASSDLKRFLP
ncbi:MAG: hypothetical protein MZU95_12400 [Desulfomicrobium escambiense]|nr:hypothetical protein [Desulfomicrobium escambiense]